MFGTNITTIERFRWQYGLAKRKVALRGMMLGQRDMWNGMFACCVHHFELLHTVVITCSK